MADREFIVYQSCSRPKYHIKDFSISWLILLITGGSRIRIRCVLHLGIQFIEVMLRDIRLIIFGCKVDLFFVVTRSLDVDSLVVETQGPIVSL